MKTTPLRAAILSVGDELTTGLTVDTNSAFISRELAALGVRVISHATVGDDQARIEAAIQRAAGEVELLVITGGIGPTPDDLTREALAAMLGETLIEQSTWTEHIRKIWSRRGRPMPESNRKQASIPTSGELLHNPIGTAAGVKADVGDCTVFVIPGVPRECRAMFAESIAPWAKQAAADRGGQRLVTRALHTFGVGESDLAERLGDLLKRGHIGPDTDVGTTAARGIVSVRIYVRGDSESDADARLNAIDRQVCDVLGDIVFGRDDETLVHAIAKLMSNDPKRPSLATAESCTGGMIAAMLTEIHGSSAHFERGFVTYSNQAKQELLGVDPGLIETHGAVSEPVAKAMAAGAMRASRASVAVSVTGIAGPSGGTESKPVGTVCIGLAGSKLSEPFARTWHFNGDRESVRLRSTYMALSLVRYHLLGYAPSDVPL